MISPYIKNPPDYFENLSSLIQLALKEDHSENDITSKAIFNETERATANIISRQLCVLCGIKAAEEVFQTVDTSLQIKRLTADGIQIQAGQSILQIKGSIRSILTAERTALNFLSLLSGISTKSADISAVLKPIGLIALDTRKTIPGFRNLSKYAVLTGGSLCHRYNLADLGLIKDNHILRAGSLTKAVKQFRQKYNDFPFIVEVENDDQLNEAINCKCPHIMLDNMTPEQIKNSVKKIRDLMTCVTIEVSGGYNRQNMEKLTGCGAGYVSMSSLTMKIEPVDFSLDVL